MAFAEKIFGKRFGLKWLILSCLIFLAPTLSKAEDSDVLKYISGGSTDMCLNIDKFSLGTQKSSAIVTPGTSWINANFYINKNWPVYMSVLGNVMSCKTTKNMVLLPTLATINVDLSTGLNVKSGDAVVIYPKAYDSSVIDIAAFTPRASNRMAKSAVSSYTGLVYDGVTKQQVNKTVSNLYCGYVNNTSSTPCWNIYGQGVEVYIGGTKIKDSVTPMLAFPDGTITYDSLSSFLYPTFYDYYNNDPPFIPNGPNSMMFYRSQNDGELVFKIPMTVNVFAWLANPPRGGYNMDIEVFSCYAEEGITPDNSYPGMVEYLITSNADPNSANLSRTGFIENGHLNIASAPMAGNLWFRIYGSTSTGTYGQYTINLTTSETTVSDVSSAIDYVIKPIKKKVYQASAIIYSSATSDKGFIRLIKIVLTLYIIFYAIGFLIGMTQLNQYEFLQRVIKIGIVLMLISDRSWGFFTYYFFDFFFYGMDNILNMIMGIQGTYQDASGVTHDFSAQRLAFVDKLIGGFFSWQTWLRLFSILITGGIGLVFFIMILAGMIIYLIAIFEALIAYLLAIIFIPVLICVAPIFIPCVLWERTREFFENWYKYLLTFFLQPVLLFTALAILNTFATLYFAQIIDFDICMKKIFEVKIDLSELTGVDWLKIDPLFSIYFFAPSFYTYSSDTLIPASMIYYFTLIMIFLIIVNLMKDMGDFIPDLAMQLSGAFAANATRQGGLGLSGRGGSGRITAGVKKGGQAAVGAISSAAGGKGGGGGGGQQAAASAPRTK